MEAATLDRTAYFLHDVDEFPSLRILSDIGVCALSPELKKKIQQENRDGAIKHCMNATSFYQEDEEEETKEDENQQYGGYFSTNMDTTKFANEIELLVDKEYHAKDYVRLATDTDAALVVLRDISDDQLAIKIEPDGWIYLKPNTHFRICSGKTRVWSVNGSGATELEQTKAEREFYHLPYWERDNTQHRRSLVVELCREFYYLGWCTGTGGSISIRQGSRIYMAPSGVQKERMKREDIFVLDRDGRPIYCRPSDMGRPKLKVSECSPLFFQAYQQRNAGACLHSHASEAVMATLLAPFQSETKCASVVSELRCTKLEMIKGITGHSYNDVLTVPIVENTPRESELTSYIEDAIVSYPKTQAILVRRHGIYVWGDTWEKAKTQAESYHYLFSLYNQAHQAGVQSAILPKNNSVGEVSNGVKYILLDIEGTTTSIEFVAKTLVPYAREHLRDHLESTWSTDETKRDVELLQKEANGGASNALCDGERPTEARKKSTQKTSKTDLVDWCVNYAESLMKQDKKSTALKQLQGHIWRRGYESGDIKGHLFPDTLDAIRRWRLDEGKRICIYSSGSCEAQKLLFQHSTFGDLSGYLTQYFDTNVGNKKEKNSYTSIQHELGVHDPGQIRFYTDSFEEAQAASAARVQVTLVHRPGNAALPPRNPFPIINSFDQE
eukprot:gb/GECG01003868.1/.p1 GENE.gb/GECG01003868.1/~~gb/GECG01003868.1/.p1  ORF type:complete len:669 (+),score=90.80 gb/GECG01003868.1/:1-2007(+)